MNWECCTPHDDRSFRQKLVDPKIKSSSEQDQAETKQAPLSIKIINALGLKEYILQKFVFRKQQPKYFFAAISDQYSNQDMKMNAEHIQKLEDKMYDEKESLRKYKLKRVFNKQQQLIIPDYTITAVILEKQNLNVPVVLLKNTNHSKYSPKLTIIYSHGNSSDVLDAYDFFAKLVKFQQVNVLIYDFTGYGISSIKTTTQRTICQDLDLIVNWLNVPKEEIVLWGFSLGTYPTVNVGAKYKFGGIILQSPIASACFFLQNQEMKGPNEKKIQKKGAYSYDKDSLDNLSHIGLIRSPIIIIHSSQDEIIPITHAKKLYDIIKIQKKSEKFLLIEVSKLNHNQMHHYFCSDTDNPLKCVLNQFLESIRCRLFLQRQIQIKTKNNNKSTPKQNPHANISPIQESIQQNQKDHVSMIPNMKNKGGKSTQKQWTKVEKDKLQPEDKNKVFISLESNIPQFQQYKNYEHEWEWEIENQIQLQVINQSNGSNLSAISARTHDYINLSAKNHKSYFNMDQFKSSNTNDEDKNDMGRQNKKNLAFSLPINKKI